MDGEEPGEVPVGRIRPLAQTGAYEVGDNRCRPDRQPVGGGPVLAFRPHFSCGLSGWGGGDTGTGLVGKGLPKNPGQAYQEAQGLGV